MARFPDGWVLVPRVEGPRKEDDKLIVDVSVDEKELVMCKHCRHWYVHDEMFGVCGAVGGVWPGNGYCSEAERRDEHEDQEADDE